MDYLSLIEEHAQAIADMKTECLADISRFAEACREATPELQPLGAGLAACHRLALTAGDVWARAGGEVGP